MFLLLVEVLTVLIFILLLPTSQELIHRFVLLGVCTCVSKSDVDDGVSLALP